MTYQFRVRDPLGNIHDGALKAASLDDATQQLRRDGFQILSLDEGDDDEEGSLFEPRVTKNDIIYTTAQLAIMVDTGITLSAALNGLVAQEENSSLRKVLS
jgi:type IV pilus assembly protein PilC